MVLGAQLQWPDRIASKGLKVQVHTALTIFARRLATATTLVVLAAFGAVVQEARAADYADMVVDVNSGSVLHENNVDAPRYPASLTKMMTLYIVFDMLQKGRLTLDTKLTISETAAAAQPSKLDIPAGETISVDNAIKALVTASANDVARAIAENLGGSEEKFAKYMTWQAKKLGMMHTTYRNASGLPDSEQMTTARDYVTLSLHLYDDFPQYFGYFKTPFFAYGNARYRNHNGLLFTFQGSDGIKTGYTRASGFNLVESVHRDGKHLIGVIFGGDTVGERNSRMRSLLTTGLAKASTQHTRLPAKLQVAAAKAAIKPKTPAATKPVDTGLAVAAAPLPKAPSAAATGKDAIGTLIAHSAPKIALAAALAPGTTTKAAPEAEAPASTGDIDPGIGPFHIQIGAFDTEAEAKQHLGAILGSAGDVIGGHPALAVLYNAPTRIWYRAQFAGFEHAQADQTCSALKSKHIACIVMRAD